MNSAANTIVFNNIKLPINASVEEAFSVARKRLSSMGLPTSSKLSVFRRSVDARKKDNIIFVYSVAAQVECQNIVSSLLKKHDASLLTQKSSLDISIGSTVLDAPPVVVGSGPAGLFAALLLAESGYKPVILERGGSVEERHIAVDTFNTTHVLDTETNIQFGAGGAGTFSDGKLVTRINDPLTSYVIERFIEYGANENIRYIAKPHIGTDILSKIVDKIINRIISLGGKIEYHTKFIRANHSDGKVNSVLTDRGELEAGALILAIGHSARDTYENLLHDNFVIESKAFSVGMRIEHLAKDIDYAMYGEMAGDPNLGHAEYNLSHDTKNRGVYTFCMCPGGEVVAAASEADSVVVNGMSYNSRSGNNSNSAVACTVFREDYGKTPEAAIAFQRKIERAAFTAGGGDYSAPVITVGDFLSGACKNTPKRIIPTYMNSSNIKLARPEEYLPEFITTSIKGALGAFDKKIRGFACNDAVLTGAETRTSAPLRILRDNDTRLAVGYKNLYPAGEGAGYAGGITSAAIDGIKSALALMKIYKP